VYNRRCLVLLTGQTKWLVCTNGFVYGGVRHQLPVYEEPLVAVEIESLNPSGTGLYGIANLTCSTPACTSILPTIGTLKTAEVHLSIGIGSPFVIPI